MFKRSIILITLALSVALSLFTPLVVNAASVYDNTIQIASGADLYVEDKSNCSGEPKHTFTTYSLGELIGTKSNWVQQNEYDTQLSSWQNADSYVIFIERNSSTSRIYLVWRDSGSIDTEFYKNSDGSMTWLDATNTDLKVLAVGMNIPCSENFVSYSPINGMTISGIVGSSTFLTYATNNVNINYPTGYEGEMLPDDELNATGFIPQFDWQVQASGAFTVRYTGNLAEQDIKPYGTFNLDVDKCENLDELCTDEIVHFSPQRPAYSAKWEGEGFTLPSEGVYAFFVGYYNNPPLAPLDIEGVLFYVEWDGKTFISGSTDPKKVITPLGYGINPVWSALNAASTPTYGLQAVVMAPFGFIQGLTQQVANCTPITMPSVYDFQFKFDCIGTKLKNDFPAAVAIYQTVLTAVVFYWVGIKFFGWVRDVNKPHRDNIEVYRL